MPVIGWHERTWRALGTDLHAQVSGPARLADRLVERVEQLEATWSRFRTDSELCRLNADPNERVEVSATLAAALERCLAGWAATDGLFDPTVIDALETTGYRDSFRADGHRRGLHMPRRATPGMEGVELDRTTATVRREPGIRFDLGGIGKGLAADLVAEELLAEGATAVCLSFGGDIRVGGVAPDGGWRIPVEDPRHGGDLFVAGLQAGAIVTSTTEYRCWNTLDGLPAHHLIDPRTSRPSESGVVAVVAAAAEAWWAEVLAKAALVAGATHGRALLEAHAVDGWMVLEHDAVVEVGRHLVTA